jgi:hypothetical protein
MRRRILTVLSVSILTLTSVNCMSQGKAFKEAVGRYSRHQVEYARAVTDCKKTDADTYSEDCIVHWAFPMSGLQCLVDEDAAKSTPASSSKSCACSNAADPANRTKACSDWLAAGN